MPKTLIDLTDAGPQKAPPPAKPSTAKRELRDTILNAQSARLRATLLEICNSSPDAFRRAQELLLVPKLKAKSISELDQSFPKIISGSNVKDKENNYVRDKENRTRVQGSNDDNKTITHRASKNPRVATAKPVIEAPKRVRPRFATCQNCYAEFDVTAGETCVRHPGTKEADYGSDVWADHDEDCHGRIEDFEDECPEGFIYRCCRQSGDSVGCRVGPHVEKSSTSKRMRL